MYRSTLQFYCMRVRIVCLPVRGALGECYYTTVLYNAACVHDVSLHCTKNILQNKNPGIILIS